MASCRRGAGEPAWNREPGEQLPLKGRGPFCSRPPGVLRGGGSRAARATYNGVAPHLWSRPRRGGGSPLRVSGQGAWGPTPSLVVKPDGFPRLSAEARSHELSMLWQPLVIDRASSAPLQHAVLSLVLLACTLSRCVVPPRSPPRADDQVEADA
jgi:hypothetical protein